MKQNPTEIPITPENNVKASSQLSEIYHKLGKMNVMLHFSVFFYLLIHLAVKTHLNLLGFITAALWFVCFRVKASRWMTCPNTQAQFYYATATAALAAIQSLHTDGTQNSLRSQAKATMCGAISNQDLMTENIHYKTQNETRSFGSSLI